MAGPRERAERRLAAAAWLVFNRLLKPNADYAIDYHTSTTGMDMTALPPGATGHARDTGSWPELFPIDQIFDNPAYPGLLAQCVHRCGHHPAFTPEIGAPREAGPRPDTAVRGRHAGTCSSITGSSRARWAARARIAAFSSATVAAACWRTHGGFVELLVKLNDKVDVGQKVAHSAQSFGEVVRGIHRARWPAR